MSRPDHPVFHGPVPVTLDVRQETTPEWYSKWTFDELPATLPAVAITSERYGPDVKRADGDRGPVFGLVTSGAGFLDTPDTEVIAGGIHSKGPDYFAIARQGRLLQWGFAGTPDEMTDAGRAIFLNALHHVVRHGGDPVVGFRTASSRDEVAASLALLDGMDEERRKRVLERTFGSDVPAAASGTREQRAAWLAEARPHLFYDADTETFAIDEDAKALGLANTDPAILRRSVEDLEAGGDAARQEATDRARRILERYTDRAFETPAEWRDWLDGHGPRLTFSDVSGYAFRDFSAALALVPRPGARPSSRDAVDLDLSAWTREDVVSASLRVRVAPGYHVYMPAAKEPSIVPMSLRLPAGSPLRFRSPPELPSPRGGHASGHFVTRLELEGEASEVVLLVDYQACTEKACLPPVTGEEIRVALEGD